MAHKVNQYFRDYVSRLKELNDFELHKPEDTIREVLSDPKRWAEEYIEQNITRNFRRILEAKRLGMEFAKRNVADKRD